jgi:hypothetical protein
MKEPNIKKYIRISDFIEDYFSYLSENDPSSKLISRKRVKADEAIKKYGFKCVGELCLDIDKEKHVIWPTEIEEKAVYTTQIYFDKIIIDKTVCVKKSFFGNKMEDCFEGEEFAYYYDEKKHDFYLRHSYKDESFNFIIQNSNVYDSFDKALEQARKDFYSMTKKDYEYAKKILDDYANIEQEALQHAINLIKNYKRDAEAYQGWKEDIEYTKTIVENFKP